MLQDLFPRLVQIFMRRKISKYNMFLDCNEYFAWWHTLHIRNNLFGCGKFRKQRFSSSLCRYEFFFSFSGSVITSILFWISYNKYQVSRFLDSRRHSMNCASYGEDLRTPYRVLISTIEEKLDILDSDCRTILTIARRLQKLKI